MLTGAAPSSAATPYESMQRSVLGELSHSERLIEADDPDGAQTILERIMALTEPWLGKEQRSTDAAFFFDWARQRIASLRKGHAVPGG